MERKPRPYGGGGSKSRSGGPGGRSGGRDGDKRPFRSGPGGPGGPRFFQKKVCRFCQDHISVIDFKDTERMRKFLTEKGKIMPRRITGNCSGCQRKLARAIKRARHSAIIAFQID